MVLLKSAPAPVAVFSSAVLDCPSVRLRSEYRPIPVLYTPAVRLPRARYPSAKLPPGQPGSGESQAALVLGTMLIMPATASISAMRNDGIGILIDGFIEGESRTIFAILARGKRYP